ncbi:CDP-alcohol phosphatidyltransferase family protein [Actinoplanes sp. NPDC051494]|uniref:CDP-alcohol phosphatidyltransferase family protein n=1 Tax=Actinoplanes sp. NPDC051494 TaxID=3363907 RepID=UPI00379B048A
MARRSSLREIREQTYKPRDAWWTVLLVDPVAAPLVRLISPYRWITPNVLTGLAAVVGLGSAACFLAGGRWWVVAGALLFHVSFLIDCMDGKIARLNGTGTMFGTWLDFMFDRLRVFLCALALFGGQYARTGSVTYLWVMIGVIFLDLFRYLDGQQMAKVRQAMREQLDEARGPVTEPTPAPAPAATSGFRGRMRDELARRRIRTHLFSGIEYEMTVFIVGPLIGFVLPAAVLAGGLMLVFELRLIFRLWQATRAFPVALARAGAAAAVDAAHLPVQDPGRGQEAVILPEGAGLG